MFLAVDIGNTGTHLGLFENGKLKKAWNMSSDPRKDPRDMVTTLRKQLPKDTRITNAAVASVVPPMDEKWWHVLVKTFRVKPVWVTSKLPLGMRIHYKPEKGVGADRLANAIGGIEKHGAPFIVVDFGTAVTFDVVDANGDYKGGVIGPGIQMTMRALHEGTALLPRVELPPAVRAEGPGGAAPTRTLGQDTPSAMRSGIVIGFAGMVREIVSRLQKEEDLDACKILITGGYGELIQGHLPFETILEPNLTLEGLQAIHSKCHRP